MISLSLSLASLVLCREAMTRGLAIATLLAACGRLSFNELDGDARLQSPPDDSSDAPGTPEAGPTDGATSDGLTMQCSLAGTPSCPKMNIGLGTGMLTLNGGTNGAGSGTQGTCGGGGAEEVSYRFTTSIAATYQISTAGSNFDTVLYLRTTDCTGTELACSDDVSGLMTSEIVMPFAANATFVAFVDGKNGQCGTFRLSITPM